MTSAPIPRLLAEWRAAERRWERAGSPSERQQAALDVVAAFAAYQTAALPRETSEFILIADDTQTYVAATPGITGVLGYEPDELVGRTLGDIAAPDQLEPAHELWTAFIVEGRQDGRFRLLAKDGRPVDLSYQARAHHPVAGFHASRLWPDAVADAS